MSCCTGCDSTSCVTPEEPWSCPAEDFETRLWLGFVGIPRNSDGSLKQVPLPVPVPVCSVRSRQFPLLWGSHSTHPPSSTVHVPQSLIPSSAFRFHRFRPVFAGGNLKAGFEPLAKTHVKQVEDEGKPVGRSSPPPTPTAAAAGISMSGSGRGGMATTGAAAGGATFRSGTAPASEVCVAWWWW